MKIIKHYFVFVILLLMIVKVSLGQSRAIALRNNSTKEIPNIDEDKIEKLAFDILNSDKDEERLIYNDDLKELLIIELNKENSFYHPLNSIKSISILTSPDSLFRIFNWNVPLNDGTYRYECGIQKRDLSSEETDFNFLVAVADSLETESFVSTDNQWIAGLFYEVLLNKTDFQTYYTLLAWDGNNLLTNKKRIDVLWFDQTDKVRFGAPLFLRDGKMSNRIIFEYSAQNTMKLNYNELNKRIVFDHLSPPNSSLKGVYEYYGSDLSYDSFYWEKNKWMYYSDIDLDSGLKKEKKQYQKAMKKEKEELIMGNDSLLKLAPVPE